MRKLDKGFRMQSWARVLLITLVTELADKGMSRSAVTSVVISAFVVKRAETMPVRVCVVHVFDIGAQDAFIADRRVKSVATESAAFGSNTTLFKYFFLARL